jgi:hypothetical protein
LDTLLFIVRRLFGLSDWPQMEDVAHGWRLWAKSSPSHGTAKLKIKNLTKNNS